MFVALAGWALSRITDLTSFTRLGLAGLGLAAVYAVLSALLLGKREIRFLWSLLGRVDR